MRNVIKLSKYTERKENNATTKGTYGLKSKAVKTLYSSPAKVIRPDFRDPIAAPFKEIALDVSSIAPNPFDYHFKGMTAEDMFDYVRAAFPALLVRLEYPSLLTHQLGDVWIAGGYTHAELCQAVAEVNAQGYGELVILVPEDSAEEII